MNKISKKPFVVVCDDVELKVFELNKFQQHCAECSEEEAQMILMI